MSIRKAAMAALVATSMVAVPTVAQAAQTANPAAKLSVASAQRVGAPMGAVEKNKLKGGSTILLVLAAAAIIAGIVIAADGGNNATSP